MGLKMDNFTIAANSINNFVPSIWTLSRILRKIESQMQIKFKSILKISSVGYVKTLSDILNAVESASSIFARCASAKP